MDSSLATRLDKVVQHTDGCEVVGRRLGRAEVRREECRRAVPAVESEEGGGGFGAIGEAAWGEA